MMAVVLIKDWDWKDADIVRVEENTGSEPLIHLKCLPMAYFFNQPDFNMCVQQIKHSNTGSLLSAITVSVPTRQRQERRPLL